MTTDVRYRIAEMGLEHYQQSADFERSQALALAACLQGIIDLVGFEPGPPYTEPLFKGIYSVPRLLEHIRSMAVVTVR